MATVVPTTGTPSQVPSSYPTRYGSAALDGIAGNQTYYCHSEHFLTAIENGKWLNSKSSFPCLTRKFLFLLTCVAWQTVYLDVKMEHFLLQHINITISPYEEGIDYLRLLQADHDKYIFTSTYLAGNLNIRHYGGGTFWYTDFLPIANQIQYLFKRDVSYIFAYMLMNAFHLIPLRLC